MQEEAFGDDEYACYLDCNDTFMGACIRQTNQIITNQIKYVQIFVYQLCFSKTQIKYGMLNLRYAFSNYSWDS